MTDKQIKIAIIEVRLIELKAEQEYFKQNSKMENIWDILIKALEAELEKLKK
jgi:hypothetical protein